MKLAGFVLGGGLAGAALLVGSSSADSLRTPAPRILSLDEVRAESERCWVTLDGGVYDVTDFLDAHPGGPHRIMMVAGNDLSAFWGVYKLHDRAHIRKLLEDYRIGSLTPADAKKQKDDSAFDSSYGNDPVRTAESRKNLRIPSEHPFNCEPSLHVLTDTFFTPNNLFFIRNHNAVPDLNEEEYTLEIEANPSIGIKETLTLTLDDLRTRFPRHEVVSALQCAGNRQEDFVTDGRPLYVAPHWRGAAIGNARWAGVKVRDVLKEAGMDVDAMSLGTKPFGNAKIASFIGEDADETGVPYAGVIPVEKAIDPFGDTILAYEMNGEELPRDHGYPIRLMAPGTAGCRNVKWVRTIQVQAQPSELDSGSKLDRHFAPDVPFKNKANGILGGEEVLRLDQGPVIQTLPIQSVLTYPETGAVLTSDTKSIDIKGVAWAGGGRGVCRVEVSIDGGASFMPAEIYHGPDDINNGAAPACGGTCSTQITPQSGMGRNWAWKQFSRTVPLTPEMQAQLKKGEKVELDIVSKAIDGDFNSQPERMSSTWNVLGICVNHWPHAKVTVCPKAKGTENKNDAWVKTGGIKAGHHAVQDPWFAEGVPKNPVE